ncbi:MAG: DUF1573 domain-containing protein [Kiritimatiellia bacterium]
MKLSSCDPHAATIPSLITVSAISLFLFALSWGSSAHGKGAQTGAPIIACDHPIFDFGQVTNRNHVEHVFVLKNAGSAPLEIKKVRGCCGASTQLGQQSIAPGSNTTLNVRLSLRGRNGKVKKVVYVHTDDPKNPYYGLRLIGTVESDVDGAEAYVKRTSKNRETAAAVVLSDLVVVPKEIYLEPDVHLTPVTKYIAIRSRKRKTFSILKTSPPESEIAVRLTVLRPYCYKIRLSNIIPHPRLVGSPLVRATSWFQGRV